MTTNSIASAIPSVDPVTFGATLVQFCICSSGLLINGFLVYTIIRNKQLRSTCCFQLILALAIHDCVNALMMASLPTLLTVTGHTISQITCFYLGSLAPFTLMNTLMLMFLISLDRFFSICLPVSYKSLAVYHSRIYVSTLIGIPAVIVFYLVVYASYPYIQAHADKQVFCQPPDAVDPLVQYNCLYFFMTLEVATILVYLTIWLLFKCKILNLIHDSVERGLLRSLQLLIAITFFCWLSIPVGNNLLLPHLQLSPFDQNIVFRVLQQPQKAAQSVNGLVLYFCSTEYRKAMRKEFDSILRWMNLKRDVAIATNNNDGRTTDANGPIRSVSVQRNQSGRFPAHHQQHNRICPIVEP